MSARLSFFFLPSTHFSLPTYSISAQIIKRRSRHGSRSAGYGFVALTTIEAAQKAVEALNNTELDGRTVIVEIAKPAEEKSREPRSPKKPRKRPTGRRGPRSVPGEVSDAEANGEIADKAEAAPGTAPATEGAEKPKKKKKKTNVSILLPATSQPSSSRLSASPGLPKQRPLFLQPMLPQLIAQKILPRLSTVGPGPVAPLVPLVKIPSANPPRPFSSLPTSALISTTKDSLLSLLMPDSRSFLLASSGRGGVTPEGARATALSTLVMRPSKRRPLTLSRARKSAVVPSLSRSPSMLLMKMALPGKRPMARPPILLSSTQLKLHPS